MEIVNLGGWIHYNSEKHVNHDIEKCGKWMNFFNDKDYISEICKKAIEENVITSTKHTDDHEGVACFYLNCDDLESHKKIIAFFIENNLIRKTKNGKLYNISFKLDDQTRNGEYGNEFSSEIKLSNFVNLETGEWLTEK